MADEANTHQPPSATVSLFVKFGGRNIPISISSGSTVRDLKTLLQPLTNVLPRGQKLIFKGKVLNDTTTIGSAQVYDGSKLMLMASHGLHQGDGPITKDIPASFSSKGIGALHTSSIKPEADIQKTRLERWKVTGVVALSDSHLKAVPEEVWACGASVRVLDLSNNSIQEVPPMIGSLNSVQRLLLNTNNLLDGGINWESVTSLKLLMVLSLNENYLTTLPSALGFLTSLRELHIAKNNLTSLPEEIGLLNHLQVLKASSNRISSLPSCIGDCISLAEVDLSSNFLVELPDTFGKLSYLKTLLLGNNGLKSLPSTIFKLCSQLSNLDLHRTEITVDLLRQFEGWEDFDERRRSKYQKQLDFRVGSSSGFDEGADEDNRSRY